MSVLPLVYMQFFLRYRPGQAFKPTQLSPFLGLTHSASSGISWTHCLPL